MGGIDIHVLCKIILKMNFIPCVTWIPKGVARNVPFKVQLTERELEKLIRRTTEELSDEDLHDMGADLLDHDEATLQRAKQELEKVGIKCKLEDEVDDKSSHEESDDEEQEESKEESEESGAEAKKENSDDDDDDDLSEYDFDKYDEEEGNSDAVLGLANLTVHASNSADPYVTLKDDDDDSEKDNFQIKPTDNLLVVGHVDQDASLLEVHGNLVAIGSMYPVIDVWDMDIVDCLEPVCRLGKLAKPKKNRPGYGHQEAVMDLSWNKNFSHVMASGSVDKTAILWDLESSSVASTYSVFKDKVQSLSWHPLEAQTLLVGSADKKVRVFDCRSENSCIKWKLPGEIERVLWNHFDPFCYFASTDIGTVHYVDCRSTKPLWQLKAHDKEVTGLSLSYECPGMLVTASADRSVKVWDLMSPDGSGQSSGGPLFISEMEDFGIGVIHCAKFCPDSPFIMCAGGDNKSNGLRVWHAAENSAVRKRFFNRKLVKMEKVDNTSTSTTESTEESSTPASTSSMETMETDKAVNAMQSMSIRKKRMRLGRKGIGQHKLKRKTKSKHKH
ncbi:hypothetical protein J437_LFUL012511 [Ladona fulva]|uniref:Periodic tryptophan protein 1 homolog n=1 Tax=Ladona fulva TaxID=123851 RepID=A0A8K0NVU5_LADFU|nr:hypothetical protein J437_LFUL012511 [Ladona fulva]